MPKNLGSLFFFHFYIRLLTKFYIFNICRVLYYYKLAKMMTSPRFILGKGGINTQNALKSSDAKPNISKDKFMSYEEKSVGTTPFFKCEACPYMALAEDDIKFHLFTFHPDLAKVNGLADNIQITCPGCTSVFDAEETLRNHLRNHHKMGIKDIRKMIKSLVRIALSNVKLKKEEPSLEPPKQDVLDVKIPEVIEIIPDMPANINGQLPNGVSYISMNELQKMSTNFEKIGPNDIQEASINIVYDNNYINIGKSDSIQESNPPDLITSIQPRPLVIDATTSSVSLTLPSEDLPQVPKQGRPSKKDVKVTKKTGEPCRVSGCYVRLHTKENLNYHRTCHQNGKLLCLECSLEFTGVERLHIHLWRVHNVDLEMPTCPICGYKTYKKSRLVNVHMKKHFEEKAYTCTECSKQFKNSNQLSKHRLIHKKRAKCDICQTEFCTDRSLRIHISTVHDKIRPYKCSDCDFAAARKEDLKVHLRLHTGVKPYSCDLCKFRCSDHNSIRRHKKKHSQENIYTCNYCPYKCIQSNMFTNHMINKHPDCNDNIYLCPYCKFKSVNKGKYVLHLNTLHRDINGIHILIEGLNKSDKKAHSWNIPSGEGSISSHEAKIGEKDDTNEISIELDDCDSRRHISQQYNTGGISIREQDMMTDISKDDCTISESSNDTIDRQYSQTDLTHFDNTNYLNPSVSMEQSILQCQNSLTSLNTSNNNIMNHFPIRLSLEPEVSVRNSHTLNPVTGPIIKPTQILPVPSSKSPVNSVIESESVPRKKPKISVKSNLILKGPDPINMFDSQQKMALKQLEDNERFAFNNLMTTQFRQLPSESVLSESPNNLMPYCQDSMLASTSNSSISNTNIFNFNTAMTNAINMMPQKDVTDPSYIKLETTIKQNTQSPGLERMCNAVMINTHEYKASPPLEDIGKNMGEIKNELKYYNIPNNASNLMDPYLIDNILEQYTGHMDMSNAVLPEQMANLDHRQDDVIEIDDNSDDHKLMPRYDVNYPLDSLYLMNNDFPFFDNEITPTDLSNEVSREVSVKENGSEFGHNSDDPVMNVPLNRHANKINVKNIELMKN